MRPETRQRWSERFHRLRDRLPPKPRKVIATVIGTALIAVGVAMMVLPGPAFLVIPAGLAVLSTEYRWARRLFTRLRKILQWRRHRKARGSRPPVDDGLAEVTRRGFRVPA